jgi:hypothetical protein
MAATDGLRHDPADVGQLPLVDQRAQRDASTGAAGDLRASVLRYVRAHLGDPALSRSAIAAAYHMSTRTWTTPR